MKSGVLPIAFVVTALAVLAPFAQGLDCFTCRYHVGSTSAPVKYLPGYHPTCGDPTTADKTGISQTCSRDSVFDPTFDKNKLKTGTEFVCMDGKMKGADGFEYGVRGCVDADLQKDKMLECQDLTLDASVGSGNFCFCKEDNCNVKKYNISESGPSGSGRLDVAAPLVLALVSSLLIRTRF